METSRSISANSRHTTRSTGFIKQIQLCVHAIACAGLPVNSLPQIVAIDQSSTASSLVDSGYTVRTVTTANLQTVQWESAQHCAYVPAATYFLNLQRAIFQPPSTRNPSLSPNRNVLRLAQPATIERWLVTSMQSTCAMIFSSPPFQGRTMTRFDWIRYPSLRTTLLCITVLSFSPRTLISCLCSRPA